MFSTVMRTLCVLFWLVVAMLGYSAWVERDWRELIEKVALVLLALVTWLAVPPGAGEFRAPTVGTRRLRIALYASVLGCASVAASPWPLWLDDSRGSDSAVVLFLATALIVPFLLAERRAGTSS